MKRAYKIEINPTDKQKAKIHQTIGWIRLKEFGYIPTNSIVKSGTVSQKANRYYVSILVEENDTKVSKPTNEGIGIDLGLKDFAICSNKNVFKNKK